ncbi:MULTISPECIES: CopM family metallochaperone [unclassified Brenneria]|uniref:CopM family metallochaperone n=1 Tax=unclassified Brenneria TaxID=2634434 RepID=UPI0015529C7B|nr:MULTISPECIES: DUF305 domain-containing protein [unclassified Brenneria]MBJ7222566.1 DUF305 domain-containing protein [Brenneria sp. L3-3C-1]MEE3643809.1 DUF305 domain-containing protein [Brenneria sp. L3_3C_1]MEE3651238.1 DUF305 domain-containing protein [Brenneria sp. HEZEL_4_2_4]NPD01194.1 DUF305 domain-containing protein [Brenneria sp. hezel4-2-4]
MKSMNLLIIGSLVAPLYAFAADGAHSGHHAENATESQQAYMQGMDRMHSQMQEGIQSSDPDVAFAKGMIAHHQGAIDMAKTELQYGKDPELRKLAEEIISAQQPEIDQMQAWLNKHGKK